MKKTKVCSIEGCGKPHAARGFCKRHYETKRLAGELPPVPKRTRAEYLAAVRQQLEMKPCTVAEIAQAVNISTDFARRCCYLVGAKVIDRRRGAGSGGVSHVFHLPQWREFDEQETTRWLCFRVRDAEDQLDAG